MFKFLFPCSDFKCEAAYVANLHLQLFPLVTPVGLSFGVFRQEWHNWISAQILYLDSFGDVINLTAAIGNLVFFFGYCCKACNVSIAFSFVVFFTELVGLKEVERDTIRCVQDVKGRK